MNIIQQIVQFQHDAGLASKPYSDFLESSYQVEEALEGFDLTLLMSQFAPTYAEQDLSSKEVSRTITRAADAHNTSLSDVDRFDKACDAIVFAIGSLTKLGLDTDQIIEGLSIVNEANKQKLGMKVDSEGKLTKPTDFENPEPKLQNILDKRDD